jgi:hypothetical protein
MLRVHVTFITVTSALPCLYFVSTWNLRMVQESFISTIFALKIIFFQFDTTDLIIKKRIFRYETMM